MKVTSAEVNKLLKRLAAEKKMVMDEEYNLAKFTAATVEKIGDVRPEYDFDGTKQKIADIDAAIRKLKHALNVFNSTTVIEEFGMTIDEVLVWLPQLSEEEGSLRWMANMPEKKREDTDGGHLIEYTYANFDTRHARQFYMDRLELKTRIQTALDLVNSTVEFDIDI